MGGALRAGNGDERVVVEAGGGGKEGGRDRDRLAGDEEGDGRGHGRALRKSGDGLTARFLTGGREQRPEQFGELSEFRARGMWKALEAGHRGHQNHILPTHGRGPFKISKLVRHGHTHVNATHTRGSTPCKAGVFPWNNGRNSLEPGTMRGGGRTRPSGLPVRHGKPDGNLPGLMGGEDVPLRHARPVRGKPVTDSMSVNILPRRAFYH